MPKILFIEHDGSEYSIEATVGQSVMQSAVDNMVRGVVGSCGGCCTCATCHGYIDPAWLGKISPKSEDEIAMLDGAMNVKENSRLTCQITVEPELDGMVIRLPESQY